MRKYIKYKCLKCKAKLETENNPSVVKEPCPDCGFVNLIPKKKRKIKRNTRQQTRSLYDLKEKNMKKEEVKQKDITQEKLISDFSNHHKIKNITIPSYTMLSALIFIFNAAAILAIITGFMIAVTALHNENNIVFVILGFGLSIYSAVILAGFAQLLTCIKDIAINSFKNNMELQNIKNNTNLPD